MTGVGSNRTPRCATITCSSLNVSYLFIKIYQFDLSKCCSCISFLNFFLSLCTFLSLHLSLYQLRHAPSITDIMIQVFIASPKAYLILLYPFHVSLLYSPSLSHSCSFSLSLLLSLSLAPTRTLCSLSA